MIFFIYRILVTKPDSDQWIPIKTNEPYNFDKETIDILNLNIVVTRVKLVLSRADEKEGVLIKVVIKGCGEKETISTIPTASQGTTTTAGISETPGTEATITATEEITTTAGITETPGTIPVTEGTTTSTQGTTTTAGISETPGTEISTEVTEVITTTAGITETPGITPVTEVITTTPYKGKLS